MKFFALAAYIAGATALGINCRGSFACTVAPNGLQNIHDQITDMVNEGSGDRWFNEGVELLSKLSTTCGDYLIMDAVCAAATRRKTVTT
ncbi:hypothetical protein SEPCBS119000_003771 [Sporothrix epigloea]|uniref:Killer toxin Kp4 domain-containing protein n=1 Tax=Sporothrix epigloea TaxID=1892477 RepID=A0ABP0DNG8_9PEZI